MECWGSVWMGGSPGTRHWDLRGLDARVPLITPDRSRQLGALGQPQFHASSISLEMGACWGKKILKKKSQNKPKKLPTNFLANYCYEIELSLRSEICTVEDDRCSRYLPKVIKKLYRSGTQMCCLRPWGPFVCQNKNSSTFSMLIFFAQSASEQDKNIRNP